MTEAQRAYKRDYMREYRKKNPDYMRNYRSANAEKIADSYRKYALEHKFGISVEQYDQMLDEQGGVCAICERTCTTGRRLAVDHDHATGEVRGLLCGHCNHILGKANDDPDVLTRAAEYLREGARVPSLQVHAAA